MTSEFLFVYGTLRRATNTPMQQLLAQQGVYVGPAVFRGRMYAVEDYPGVVMSTDPAEEVRGEVYQLLEPESLLRVLDRYECCGEDDPEPTLYIREKHDVRLTEGEILSAWIYIYNRPVEDLSLIPGGDFLHTDA